MNRNVRRIALSLVAIVLGAGYLLKVIPPETDVGIDENYSVSIDGTLITNPLDINEKVFSIAPANLFTTRSPLVGQVAEISAHEGYTPHDRREQFARREPLSSRASHSDATSSEGGEFLPQLWPNSGQNEGELSTDTPPLNNFLISPIYSEETTQHLGILGRGNGIVGNSDDGTSAPGQSPNFEGLPAKPVDTNDNEQSILPPLFLPELPLHIPVLEEIPQTAALPYVDVDGPTSHNVPDFGSTLLLLALSLGSAALVRAAISSKKDPLKG